MAGSEGSGESAMEKSPKKNPREQGPHRGLDRAKAKEAVEKAATSARCILRRMQESKRDKRDSKTAVFLLFSIFSFQDFQQRRTTNDSTADLSVNKDNYTATGVENARHEQTCAHDRHKMRLFFPIPATELTTTVDVALPRREKLPGSLSVLLMTVRLLGRRPAFPWRQRTGTAIKTNLIDGEEK